MEQEPPPFQNLYDTVIPDVDYYLRQIDCRDGCPVNTDPRGYMMALHRGDYLEGYKIARGPNPFASICGMICGAPCELTCRRDRVDKTLTIRAQKRFLDEWFGLSKKAHIKSLGYSYARGSITPKPNGLKIACIGAGVASLTCAHDLLRLGYSVDIFEMMRVPGGMLTYGVPSYRLKNEVAFNEIAAIEHLGAKIHYNVKLGAISHLTSWKRSMTHSLSASGFGNPKTFPSKGQMNQISYGELSICGCAAWKKSGGSANILW